MAATTTITTAAAAKDRLTDPLEMPLELLTKEIGRHLPLQDLCRLGSVNRSMRDRLLPAIAQDIPVQKRMCELVEAAVGATAPDKATGYKTVRDLLYQFFRNRDAARWTATWRALQHCHPTRMRSVRPLELFRVIVNTHIKQHGRRLAVGQLVWLDRAMVNIYGTPDPARNDSYKRHVQPRWRALLEATVKRLSLSPIKTYPWLQHRSLRARVAHRAGFASFVTALGTKDLQAVETHLLHNAPLSFVRPRSDRDQGKPSLRWRKLLDELETATNLATSRHTKVGTEVGTRRRVPNSPFVLTHSIERLFKESLGPALRQARPAVLNGLVTLYLRRLKSEHYPLLQGVRAFVDLCSAADFHPILLGGADLPLLAVFLDHVRARLPDGLTLPEYLRAHTKLERKIPAILLQVFTAARASRRAHRRKHPAHLDYDLETALPLAQRVWALLADDAGLVPDADEQRRVCRLLLSTEPSARFPAEVQTFARNLPGVRETRTLAGEYETNRSAAPVRRLLHRFASLASARTRDGFELSSDVCEELERELREDRDWRDLQLTSLADPLDAAHTAPQQIRRLYHRYISDRLADMGTWYDNGEARKRPRSPSFYDSRSDDDEAASPKRARLYYSPASPAYSPASPPYVPRSPEYPPSASPPAYAQNIPASPQYVPSSPVHQWHGSPPYPPSSPGRSPPASPQYVPRSPVYSPDTPPQQ